MTGEDRRPYRVVVLDHPFANLDTEQRVLATIGGEVVDAGATSEAERIDACRQADAVILEKGQVTEAVIAAMECCEIIVAYGAGYDQIDLAAATERGIMVANTPGYCDEEVADHALMLLYALARRLYPQVRALAAAANANQPLDWTYRPYVPIRRLRGQTLGIIGFGRIGRTLARKAQGVGLDVIAADPVLPLGIAPGTTVPIVSLDDLLGRADFVSLHLPLLPTTRHLLGRRELALLKPTSYLVNCARGPIVDLEALLAALEGGRLGRGRPRRRRARAAPASHRAAPLRLPERHHHAALGLVLRGGNRRPQGAGCADGDRGAEGRAAGVRRQLIGP